MRRLTRILGVLAAGAALALVAYRSLSSAPATVQAARAAPGSAAVAVPAIPGPVTAAPAPPAATSTGPAAGATAPFRDPAAILQSASRAYSRVSSMRARFTQTLQNAFLRRTVTSHGILYQKRPDKFLMRFTQPEGDLLLSDGTHFWIYYPSADPGQVIRTPAGTGAGAVDLQAQFVGDPTTRFDYVQEGSEAVGGREAHVILLTPRDPDAGYRSLKVWLDAEDFLARRFEIVELNGNVRRIELADLELDPPLEDSLFRFEPPAGVRIVER